MADHDADDLAELRRLLHEGVPAIPDDPHRAARARRRARRVRATARSSYAAVVAAVVVVVGVPVGLHLAGHDHRSVTPSEPTPATCATSAGEPRVLPRSLRRLGADYHWVGSGRLWVDVAGMTGTLDSRRLKFGTFTLDAHGQMSAAAGPPSLTARQLDGKRTAKGDPLVMDNFATATDDAVPSRVTSRFWPTTITLPADGCWRLTVHLRQEQTTFTVRVAPATKPR